MTDMTEPSNLYGPNTGLVLSLLEWISSSNLMQFHGPVTVPYTLVTNLEQAVASTRIRGPECVDWTEVRDNADAGLYPVGLLDEPQWSPFRQPIFDLVDVIDEKVRAALATEYRKIIDDIRADLRTCAVCLAVHGKLDPFHDLLWQGYHAGGWPCGWSGPEPEPPAFEIDEKKCRMRLFWKQA